ncbi:MAG: PaaI family thioesterase [Thermodesulfobacteriota bacterium]
MIDKERIPKDILVLLEEKLEGRTDEICFPPPVFDALKGEVLGFDHRKEALTNRFPILKEHLNPYGFLQGGIISAAIDNTIGPLSLLVSPPSLTRYMTVKYARAVSPELDYIYITARYGGKKKRFLYFDALVKDGDGNRLASAQATHYLVD